MAHQDPPHSSRPSTARSTVWKRVSGRLGLGHRDTHNMDLAGMSEEYETVMLGMFRNLPPINTKLIKIFLSSTFSDLGAERNFLMQSVYPQLKDYCRNKYGIEFQVVDMRWGVRQEAQLDHQGPQLCFEELRNCQAVSAGPSFFTILGQRYGRHPPPYNIPADEFQHIIDTLEEVANPDNAEALAMMNEWYQKDENSLPAEYVLKPIAENSHEMKESDLKEAKAAWEKAESIIKPALMRVAQHWENTGRYSAEHCHKYFCSVTENEVVLGVLDPVAAAVSRRYAAAFLRYISDMEEHLDDERVGKFFDMDESSPPGPDNLLQKLIHELNEVKIVNNLPKSRIYRYNQPWNAVVERSEAREAYLRQFGEDFVQCCQRLVDESMRKRSEFSNDDLYVEVLQHSTTCVNYVKHFQGRKEILNQLKEYLTGDSEEVLVVHGASGSGKTSILGKCASESRAWLSEDQSDNAIVLLRFLGTSPGTSSIRQTLRYLCRQLACFSSDSDQQTARQLETMQDACDFFQDLLNRLGAFRKILVFLDSLDQLDGSDGCYHLGWLPVQLPANVKLVVSTLPDMYGLLDTLRTRILDEKQFVEVTPLESHVCVEILRAQLNEAHRQLTLPQWELVTTAFQQCSLPIYVTLMLHQAKTWKSFYPVTDYKLRLEYTVRGAILQLFQNLEKKHGPLLTSHALGYITASKNGLSEAELEDLLSLDDAVLQDVFQFHLPPQMRIPPFCWSRLRHDIGKYLVEREADNSRVLFWYHRQFIEVARDHFLATDEIQEATHDRMADYFLDRWSKGRKKVFVYPQYIRKKMNLPESIEADRFVMEQPTVFDESEPYETTANNGNCQFRLNLRRLNELPWHLSQTKRLEECYSEIAFNYHFLFNKLRGTTRFALLEDLDRIAKISPKEMAQTVTLVYNAIRIATDSLNFDARNLSVDLTGRLASFRETDPWIGRLLDACYSEGGHHSVIRLKEHVLDSGSGEVHTSFNMALSVAFVLPTKLICSVSMTDTFLRLFDLNGNLVRCVDMQYNIILSIKQLMCHSYFPEDCVFNLATKAKKQREKKPEGEDVSGEESSKVDVLQVNLATGQLHKLFGLPLSIVDKAENVKYTGSHWLIAKSQSPTMLKFYHIPTRTLHPQSEEKFSGEWAVATNNSSLVIRKEEQDCTLLTQYMSHDYTKAVYVKKFSDSDGETLVTYMPLVNTQLMTLQMYDDEEGEKKYAVVLYTQAEEEGNGVLQPCRRLLVPFENLDFNLHRPKEIRLSRGDRKMFVKAKVTTTGHTDKTELALGIIWHCDLDTFTLLSVNPNSDMGKRAVKVFARRKLTVLFSDDGEYLFVSSQSYLALIFSTSTGQFINFVKHSQSAGFISGMTQDPNLLIFSTFEEDKNDDNKMYVVCRIMNLDTLLLGRKDETVNPTSESATDDVQDDDESQPPKALVHPKDFPWSCNDDRLIPLSSDPLSELFYLQHEDSYSIYCIYDGDANEILPTVNSFSDDDKFGFMNSQIIAGDATYTSTFSLECLNFEPKPTMKTHLMFQIRHEKPDPPPATEETNEAIVENESVNYNVITFSRAHQFSNRTAITQSELKKRSDIKFGTVFEKRGLLVTLLWEVHDPILINLDGTPRDFMVEIFSLKTAQLLNKITIDIPQISTSPNFAFPPKEKEDTIEKDEAAADEATTDDQKTTPVKEVAPSNNEFQWIFDGKWQDHNNSENFYLRQVVERPAHPEQIVLVAHCLSELRKFSISLKQRPDLTPRNLFNLGFIIILDFRNSSEENEHAVVSNVAWCDIYNEIVFLPDGLHAINYRLQVLNIETGRIVRSLRPLEDEVYLLGLIPFYDTQFICGILLPPSEKVNLDIMNDDESIGSNEGYITPLMRVLQIYRTTDGALVGNYVFNEEARWLQRSGPTGKLLYYLAEGARLPAMEIDVSHLLPPAGGSAEDSKMVAVAGDITTTCRQDKQSLEQSGISPAGRRYFQQIGIDKLLNEAMFQLVEERPLDPIAYLSEFLRQKQQSAHREVIA